MWSQLITFTTLATIIIGEELVNGPPVIQRDISDGVKSVSYKVVFGDEDMAMINEVITDVEKHNGLKKRVRLNEAIAPLPAQDVKCLMSVDRYCSEEMLHMKSVLINALKEDCAKCSIKEKEKAGKMIAAMMAFDRVAWKLFLTRAALLITKANKQEEPIKQKPLEFKLIGEPEEVIRPSGNSYVMPGVKVRVKRYPSEIVSN